MSIPDLAVEIVNKTLKDANEDTARTIILVGSKSAGKSHLLYSFLEKSETPRETLVLEYSFGRKSSQKPGMDKTICHVWEYGGKLEMLHSVLISVPIKGKFYFCIMVDLSKIKTIWNVLETCYQAMKENYSDSDYHPELVIIGGKYDIFKNYDSEIKKVISTTMRSFALISNGNLLFYSSKEPQLVRRAKEMFFNMGFGNGVSLKEKNTNYSKPLSISKGQDTWENIGIPQSTLDQIKQRHISRITPEMDINQEVKPLQRSHPEPILDSLATLKYDELRNMEHFDPALNEYLMLIN
ncbi:cytoplasmic dynein 2 light intermediate chain 1 isoform X1 [Danaus plexippus]|uniref:cytoplasmic dynein 2 light intermediate chain 1 isoform X1 n=1 Tax=Danaus plexippus TaxID=13037 RepID=UPI002AAF3445|nr:cytoplasmic dynein 2 light intermediate chain 1 isoform X1 [Danaus plexippus]